MSSDAFTMRAVQIDLNLTSFMYLASATVAAMSAPPPAASGIGPSAPDTRHDGDRAGNGTPPSTPAPVAPAGDPAARQQARLPFARNPRPGRRRRRRLTLVNISSVSVDTPYEYFSIYG